MMVGEPYYVSSGIVIRPVEALETPPSEVRYIVARSKGEVAAAKMAARLHGTPCPPVISCRSSSRDDVLAILSDHTPRTTDCIHQELHAAYRRLPFPWRWIWKIPPFKWQVSDALDTLWTRGKIASYGGTHGSWTAI